MVVFKKGNLYNELKESSSGEIKGENNYCNNLLKRIFPQRSVIHYKNFYIKDIHIKSRKMYIFDKLEKQIIIKENSSVEKKSNKNKCKVMIW